MKLLAEISDGTLGLSNDYEKLKSQYQLRKSARAILLNTEGKIAVQYLRTYAFHKLPGGGLEYGEALEDAAQREVREEVGCDCDIVKPVGMTIEYRNVGSMIHISYCFVASVKGTIESPQLSSHEVEEGHETIWLSPVEALKAMKTDTPRKYEGHFILQREVAFLEEFLGTKYTP